MEIIYNTIIEKKGYIDTEQLSLIKNIYSNTFNIQFITINSSFYCSVCIKGICLCDNKDWVKNRWKGFLFAGNGIESFELIKNIYLYFKDNFEYLLELNQNELKYFLYIKESEFLLDYYYDKILYLFNSIKKILDLGVYKKNFYHKFRQEFINKYKNMNIRNDDTDQIIDSFKKICLDECYEYSIDDIKILLKYLDKDKQHLFVIEQCKLNFSTMFIYINSLIQYYSKYDVFDVIFDTIEDDFFVVYYELLDIKQIWKSILL